MRFLIFFLQVLQAVVVLVHVLHCDVASLLNLVVAVYFHILQDTIDIDNEGRTSVNLQFLNFFLQFLNYATITVRQVAK